jgi:hypothetical protein
LPRPGQYSISADKIVERVRREHPYEVPGVSTRPIGVCRQIPDCDGP